MINAACRLLLLLSLAFAGCAGAGPVPDPDDDEDSDDDDDDPADDPNDPSDPNDPGGGTAACDAAWECSDTCGEQMACADTDDACWEGCDSQCGLEQACGADPGDPGDPGGGGDPAACDAAWECSDTCGAQMQCEDDACWEQCDASCGLEEACAGVEDPTDPGDPGGGGVPTCDEAWECSDQCGYDNDCGWDDACWEQCDAECQLEEACAGEF